MAKSSVINPVSGCAIRFILAVALSCQNLVALAQGPTDTAVTKTAQPGDSKSKTAPVKKLAPAQPAKPPAAAASTAAASSGKSVSMINASPLAPPLTPKIDTSGTPAKPASAAAKPPAAKAPAAAPTSTPGTATPNAATNAAPQSAPQRPAYQPATTPQAPVGSPFLPPPAYQQPVPYQGTPYQPQVPYQPPAAYQPPLPYQQSVPYQPQSQIPAQNPAGSPVGQPPANPAPGAPAAPLVFDDNYPVIGTLETSIFGSASPKSNIDERLTKLETAVYKTSFPTETLFDRTERLKATLMGLQPPDQNPMIPGGSSRFLESAGLQSQSYFDSIAALPENQVEVPPEELTHYFFTLLNGERQKFGYAPLEPDEVAQKMAKDHAAELCSRRVMSHQDVKGNNPDRRYTLAGGNDLLYESIVSIGSDPGSVKLTRAIAVNLLKTIMNRQDEREALLSADATGLGFAIDWTKSKDKVVACSDVLTRHGVIQPIPSMVQVGDKVEVKGVIMPPFHFDKITVAWEGKTPGLSSVADESEEALPYFAPLDYTGYAHHSDNDHSGTLTALKTAGIIAAIAGGVFIPPVALAAPLIALSGSNAEPKPASDIPVKGGVKVDGNAFDGKVAINHEGKEGLYYITVWASLTKYGKPIAISRRAILATSGGGEIQEVGKEKVSAERVDDSGAPVDPEPVKGKHKHNKQKDAQPLPNAKAVADPASSSAPMTPAAVSTAADTSTPASTNAPAAPTATPTATPTAAVPAPSSKTPTTASPRTTP